MEQLEKLRLEFEDNNTDLHRKCEIAWQLLRVKVQDDALLAKEGKQLTEFEVDRGSEYINFLLKNGATFKVIAEEILKTSE